MIKLTENITAAEMRIDLLKPTDYAYQMAEAVADNLQAIRDYYGKPIRIHSGYRTPEHNARIGGSATSQHQFGEAADFSMHDTELLTIYLDVVNGKIKLPHKISQLILEQSKIDGSNWGWIHLGIWTRRFEEQRKFAGKDANANQFLVQANGVTNYLHNVHLSTLLT